MLTLAAGALCLVALAGGSWLVGRLLLPAGLCRGAVEELALGSALGFVVAGQLDFLLRLCGWRLAPAALALLMAGALAAALARRRLVGLGARRRAAESGVDPRLPRRAAGLGGLAGRLAVQAPLGVLLAAGGVPLFLLALYPAVDPDPGIYHLPYARAFVERSGLPFLADLRFPVFPQLNELLFAIGLRLHGTTGAHLVEVALALCTALLLWTWGREVGGTVAGLVAAGLWLGNPLVILLGSTAHVDVGVACFALAGLFCLERARQAGRGPGGPGGTGAAWPAMAGAFLGGAAAVKYLGLFLLAAGGVAAAVRRHAAAAFAAAALVVVAPVYAHILQRTGNPIFPFFPQVFGYTEWTHDQGLRADQVRPIPVPWTGATLRAMARFPLQRATALLAGGTAKLDELARADRDPPHIRSLRRLPGWGRSLVLAALAATWVRALWRPQLRLAVAVALASLVVWLSTFDDVQRLDPRYILSAGPPLALATGAALAELAAAAGKALRGLAAPLRTPLALPAPFAPSAPSAGSEPPAPPAPAAGSGPSAPPPPFAPSAQPPPFSPSAPSAPSAGSEPPAPLAPPAPFKPSTPSSNALRTLAAVILALAVVAPGLAYARIRARYLGPLPLSQAGALAVARAHLPGFDALQDLARRHGTDSAVYNLDLAHLAFYAPGRYLGDAFGPARYSRIQGSFGSGAALYAALRRFGADHLLAPRSHLTALPADPTFAEHFRVEHADEGAVLWELQPLPATAPPPPPPRRTADPRQAG